MQWVMTSLVRYYHKKNKTSGHIWQGRYKSFMVEKENYYITLIRYIEANALRAKLVRNAQDWEYGSLMEREHKHRTLLSKTFASLVAPTTELTIRLWFLILFFFYRAIIFSVVLFIM